MANELGIEKIVDLSYEDAIVKAKDELKKEGFGVLTEIDVKKTLQEKIGVDFEKYIILGACNPQFAHKTLTADKDVGLLLPCNVIVYENNEGQTVVSAVEPLQMMQLIDNAEVKEIAKEVSEKLHLVINSI